MFHKFCCKYTITVVIPSIKVKFPLSARLIIYIENQELIKLYIVLYNGSLPYLITLFTTLHPEPNKTCSGISLYD